MALYKQLIKKIHPDLNGDIDESSTDKISIIMRYKHEDAILLAYAKKWGITVEADEEDILIENLKGTFRFPYPDCEFREDDWVMVNQKIAYKITNIFKDESSYVFDLFRQVKSEDGEEVPELIQIVKPNLRACQDVNFYLYKARWGG